MIQAAFGVHNKNGYIIHTLVCVYSILANAASPAHIHIFHDDSLDAENMKMCRAVTDHFSAPLTLHKIDVDREISLAPYIARRFGIGCMFRLYIPERIEGGTVVYFDSDMCCNVDVARIMRYCGQIGRCCLMAVQDDGCAHEKFSAYLKVLELDPLAYFNTGLLVFNIDRINSLFPSFSGAVFEVLKERRDWFFPDQDALNFLFFKKHSEMSSEIKYLPSQFNFNVGIQDRHMTPPARLANKIVHYCNLKPWEKIFPAAMVYWQYREKLHKLLTEKGLV